MDASVTDGATQQAGRREWIGLAVLALPTLLLSLDMSVLYLALPSLSADLGPSGTQTLWLTDIYGFMIAGFLVTMGTLGDRIGRRRLLMIGAAAFGGASALAAFSPSAELLIASRALMGVTGATLMPSTLALIGNMFTDPKQRASAMAIWMSCFMGGMAVGPLVGGVLLQFFWWGSVFLLGVPVMVLLLVVAPVLLPEYRDTSRSARPDLGSVALSLGAVLPVIYGLKELAKAGAQPLPIAALAIGLAVGVVFVRRQRRLSDPLLDVALFGNRTFSATLLVFLLGAIVMGGINLFVTQYLQLVAGLSPLSAGLWLLPQFVAMIAVNQLSPVLARRVRPAAIVGGGLALAAVGMLLLTQADSSGGLTVVVLAFVIAAAGMGPSSLLVDLIVGSAPPEKAGSAGAVSETSGEFGIAMGLATLGSIGTAVYHGRVADSIPAGTPADAAAAARESIAGAASAAERLPAAAGAELLAGAREAFTAGMVTVGGVGTVVLAVLAALTFLALRHVRPYGEAPPGADRESAPETGDDSLEALVRVAADDPPRVPVGAVDH